ncbi:MAG: SWIM zinc finger family protein [Nitrososphaerota archaeon]
MEEEINDLEELKKKYGEKYIEAIKCVKEKRVKKYIFKPSNINFWIVVGYTRDYLVLPEVNFCSCNDFFFHVLDKKYDFCYHILAVKIALKNNLYEEIIEEDTWYEKLIKEWKA